MVGVGLAVCCGLFLVAVVTERPSWVPVAGMLAAAVVLTLVADESFAVMFGYVASAAGVRLHGGQSVLAVGGITALAAAQVRCAATSVATSTPSNASIPSTARDGRSDAKRTDLTPGLPG